MAGADSNDWNHQTYWHHPWGKSGVHKGIDIFGPKGRPVISPVNGLVIQRDSKGRGGKSLLVLGPKWRFHYLAHMDWVRARPWRYVTAGETLGSVGDSGNARGKPPHLHYAIFSAVPYPWRWRARPQGWKQMFFLNPHEKLVKTR